MKRILVLTILSVGVVAGPAAAQATKSAARLVVPDDKAGALKAVQDWLETRGFDCELRGEVLLLTRDGILYNILPIVTEKQLDRLLVSNFYHPKDEFKGSKELSDFAAEKNRSENFLRVFIDGVGDFGVSSSLTFYDEVSAREFDSFLELYAGVLRKYILTPEALKMLK